MNINIYLEDAIAKSLNKCAKASGHTRNAIIREAIKEWIRRHEVRKWPQSILQFKGVKSFIPFEDYRSELKAPKEDPFA